jgi:raffinose/stachyose/melibiose transport system permease protein
MSQKSFITPRGTLIFGAAVLICAVMFLPFIWGFILSFKDNTTLYNSPLSLPKTLDFSLYADTFNKASMPTLFKNSFVVSTLTTLGALIINFLSSFAIARLYHRHAAMGDFFYFLFLIGAAVPLFIAIFPIYTVAQ